MRRHERLLLLLAAAFAVAAFVLGLSIAGPPSKQHIVNVAQGNLKKRAVEATIAAQTVPVIGCNPAPGGAKLGVCAPTQAFAAAGSLAQAAGDPFHIAGHPLGVDTSSYQPCGYSLTGLSFAGFKGTEGTRYTDRCLRANVAQAKRQHKPYTIYDFLRPGSSSAYSEAQHFISEVALTGANTSLPPTADVEANAGLDPAQLHNYVCAWHNTIRKALHRSVTITYTGNWFWQPQVGRQTRCGSILWISAYASSYLTPFSWIGHGGATIWQYSDGRYGPTPHLHGWDSDVFVGTHGALARLANAKHDKPPTAHANALCREHEHYLREQKRHTFPAKNRARAAAVRAALVKAHYRCTTAGKAVRK